MKHALLLVLLCGLSVLHADTLRLFDKNNLIYSRLDTSAVICYGQGTFQMRPDYLPNIHYRLWNHDGIVIYDDMLGHLITLGAKGQPIFNLNLPFHNISDFIVLDSVLYFSMYDIVGRYDLRSGHADTIRIPDEYAHVSGGLADGEYFYGRGQLMLTSGNGDGGISSPISFDVVQRKVNILSVTKPFFAHIDSCGRCDCQAALLKSRDELHFTIEGQSSRFLFMSSTIFTGTTGTSKLGRFSDYYLFDKRECTYRRVANLPFFISHAKTLFATCQFLNDTTAVFPVVFHAADSIEPLRCVFFKMTFLPSQ